MKVWIVYGGEYEQWFISGVFSSFEKAEEFCAKHKRGDYRIDNDLGELVDDPEKS